MCVQLHHPSLKATESDLICRAKRSIVDAADDAVIFMPHALLSAVLGCLLPGSVGRHRQGPSDSRTGAAEYGEHFRCRSMLRQQLRGLGGRTRTYGSAIFRDGVSRSLKQQHVASLLAACLKH